MRQAVIVCGGRGLRLAQVTGALPKALVPLDGKPLLNHQLNELRRNHIREVILCVGYGARQIRRFCATQIDKGVRIVCSEENKPLGTAGAVRAIKEHLDRNFYVVYGDLLFCVDLQKLGHAHLTGGGLATLLLHPSDHPYDSDIVELDRESRIIKFAGKRKPGELFANLTSAAIYALDRRIIEHIPEDSFVDFTANLFPSLLKQGYLLKGFLSEEYCRDVGQKDRYYRSLRDLKARLVHNHV